MSRSLPPLQPFLVPCFVLLLVAGAANADSSRQVLNFNADWQVHRGAISGINAIDDDTLDWQPVHLPHDAAIAGPFDPEANGSQGKLPWKAQCWYKKSFTLQATQLTSGRRVILQFDGVMSNPRIYVNDQLAGRWNYGYNAFWFDITEHVKAGVNEVVVQANNEPHYSRWYPGLGIFRDVKLLVVDPVHVPLWGVYITTPEISDDKAAVNVATEITNTTSRPQTVVLTTTLINPDGSKNTSQEMRQSIPAGETVVAQQSFVVYAPQRWDITHPRRYTAQTTLSREDDKSNVRDELQTRFGIRSLQWTANDGFHLNGRRVQLKGVCLHHDNGPLGGVALRDAEERKLRIMKDMGVNAIRTSHNAPSTILLDLCDEMGLIVIDELFDKWGPTASVDVKTAEFVNKYAEAEVRNFVRRDRNHPSVCLWSIGNEIADVLTNRDGHGEQHIATMHGYFKKYDPTRQTNMACHIPAAVGHGVLTAVDTLGWNYGQRYLRSRQRYPEKPLIYTESASAFSTRGYYQFPHPTGVNDFNPQFTESSYDRTSARWSDIPDHEFQRMERDRYLAGEFVWTGFDYLGEPTPHTKDARSSYFGIVDLVGLPKDRFYLYRAYWRDDDHTVHILPHWTWPDRQGKNVPVYVYTDGDEAELFLNGKSLGRRKKQSSAEQPSSSANLALGKPATASTEEVKTDGNGNVQATNLADKAFDGARESRWCASSGHAPEWLAVDLGQPQPIGFVMIDWEMDDDRYTYELQVSDDGENWRSVGGSDTDEVHGSRTLLTPDVTARHVRVFVSQMVRNGWASIRELRIEKSRPENLALSDPYYDVIHRYRLCWENVTYQPGELKAVAYQDGQPIGEQTVTTAGEPVRLRLIPESRRFAASGESLIYVRVEAVDTEGRLCPHAMHDVTFKLTGPATIAGIGNGDPTSLDPFTDDSHPLFYGQAVLILRSVHDQAGEVIVKAQAEGIEPAQATLTATPAKED